MTRRCLILSMIMMLLLFQTIVYSEIKFSGEIRLRPEYYGNKSYNEGSSHGYIRSRVKINAAGKVNDFITADVGMVFGDESPRYWGDNKITMGTDYNFRLYKAYFTLKEPEGIPLTVKAGRQSLTLSEAFLFSDRGDGVDGIHASYKISNSSINALWFKAQENNTDNASSDDEDWYGLYVNLKDIIPDMEFIPYYIINHADSAAAVNGIGRNDLNFMGLRVLGKVGDLSYKAEYSKEGGELGEGAGKQDKDADAIALGVFYKFSMCKVGLEYFRGSGNDQTTADDEDYAATNHNLDDFCFGRVNEYEIVNLDAIRLSVMDIKITDNLKIGFKYHKMNKSEVPAGNSDDMSDELDIEYKYSRWKNFGISGFFGFEKPGDGLSPAPDDKTKSKIRLEIKAKF